MTRAAGLATQPETKDLRSFLRELEAHPTEQILRVTRTVSPVHELSAVVKLLEPRDSPVVFFQQVAGSSLPVIAGLFGTNERIAIALGVPVDACVDWFLTATSQPLPSRLATQAPVKDVQYLRDQVDLDVLPICVHSPADSGRYITSGVTILRDPRTAGTQTAIYRMAVIDRNHVTVNIAKDISGLMSWAARNAQPVEFATVIGHHPAVLIASQAQSLGHLDGLGITGALLREPLDVTAAETVDVPVPANSEIVLEGRLAPEQRPDGQFGEFTYYYDRPALAWVGEITAITHRSDAIFLDIHPTHGEHRCLWLFPGREARLLAALREEVSSVKAVHLPLHGAGLSAYISLDKPAEGEATQALELALRGDSYLKHAIALDADINIHDDRDVLWAMNVRLQGNRDLLLLPDLPGARMDPSAYSLEAPGERGNLTTKIGFDATLPPHRRSEMRADTLPEELQELDLSDYVTPRR